MKHDLNGRTVLVAGMGKSGIAAIDLLRSARSACAARRTSSPSRMSRSTLLPQTEETFTRRRSDRSFAGRAGGHRACGGCTGERHSRHWRSGTRELFPQGADLRDHGLERQDHHDGADRASSERMRDSPARSAAISGHRRRRWSRPRATNSGTCWSCPVSNSKPSTSSAHNIGVCTNVTPDHLDRHHTFENYADAKARLFETQTAE